MLLVLPWSPALPGGVSVVVRNLVTQLERTTLRPVVVVSDWGVRHPETDADGTLRFRFLVLGTLTWAQLVKSILAAPVRLAATLRFLRTTKAEAVNFHYPRLDVFGVALLKRLGLFRGRLILSFHGTEAYTPATPLDAFLWQIIFASADAVSACSSALASQVAEAFRIAVERITVIHNGVDSDRFSPIASRHETTPASLPARYLISVGSYIPRKGHRVLVDAFAGLADEFPELGLVIAGMDGPERAMLIEQAQSLGLGARLSCLVDLSPPTVAAVLARADVCVQPSFAEPFGLAVIEAGACGVPVAATSVGGHVELLRDRETGFLFPPGDAAACATVVRQMLLDPTRARGAADRFRNEVLTRFTWENCARGYMAIIDKAKTNPALVTAARDG